MTEKETTLGDVLEEGKHVYTPEEEQAILERYRAEHGFVFPFDSIEDLLTSPAGFNLTTATPLQRAICRVIEGIPLEELRELPIVQRALACETLEQDGPPPEVDLIAAVRCAKSMIAGVVAIWASQHCDMSGLAAGEIPRYSIVSLEKDNAAVTLAHLVAALQQPDLVPLRVPDKMANPWMELIKETGIDVIGTIFLWHPSGRPVEIRITAGKRAGGGLVSRWSIGVCLDEAPRMHGQDESVINYDEARKAVRTRLRPGAQILSIGSPWRAMGPMYTRFLSYWGNPTTRRVVIKANGPSMNPIWWTPERCEEIRIEDPDAYKTDVLAEFLEPLEALVHPLIVNRNVRKHPPHYEWEEGHEYVASMDPATRGNAWTFAIGDRVAKRKRTVYNEEWQGTAIDPLSPRAVLIQIGRKLREYKLDWAYTDQWSSDAIIDIACELIDPDTGEDISFTPIREAWTNGNKKEAFKNFADGIADDQVELPPDPQVATDIRLVQKRRTGSDFTIVLPKQGTRHCDYAPTVVRLFQHWIAEDLELPPEESEEGYNQYLEDKMEQKEVEEFEREQGRDYWDIDLEEVAYGRR